MDDELSEAHKLADEDLAPPPFGKLEIVVPGSPASVQSSKAVRDAYLASIKASLSRFHYVLIGQLMLEVVWLLPAKSRFETDAKADIDNCLKPIIDAFTGPSGLFINDCQLKGLYICWRSIESDAERLVFSFEFEPDQFSEREGLAFLRLEKGLCCPVNTTWPKAARAVWVNAMRTGGFFKAQFEKLGVSYLALAGMQGGGQPFHITRTGGFRVLSPEEFVAGAGDA